MKRVFADTCYWVAASCPRDSWRERARAAEDALGNAEFVTTDEVLAEFLTLLSSRGPDFRRIAVRAVRAVLRDPHVTVLPQSRESFLKGLDRYESRPDKDYSLTDCISMNVMEDEGITEVLTNDHHFEQERFVTLIR